MAPGAAALAQPAPGREFRVNSYTTYLQEFSSVGADGQGNFLIVWTDVARDGGDSEIFARRLSASGRRLGPQFQLNTYTTGFQQLPVVAVGPNGHALAVWFSSADGVRLLSARRVDAVGHPLGAEFQVDVVTSELEDLVGVAADEDGGFLVTWTRGNSETSFARRIPPSGPPASGEIALGNLNVSGAAHLAGGGFVVVGDRTSAHDVLAVRLDENGAPTGPPIAVNTETAGDQFQPDVAAAASGNFLVIWRSQPPGALQEVRARRFDQQGQPLGPEFRVNPANGHPADAPRAAFAPDGGFTVTWIDVNLFDWDVWERRYDAAGASRGAEFRVNEFGLGLQLSASPAISPTGQILVSWDEGFFGDISARQFGMVPASLRVDASPASSNGNGVLEPGETVSVEPTWANRDQADWTVGGSAAAFTGPGPAGAYSVPDASATYGFIADGGSASCAGAGDCYRLALGSVTRPLDHWDATLREQLTNGFGMNWTLHVGGSFADVPVASAYYRSIETLLHNGVTGGCGANTFCPSSPTTREQMAAFVLAGAEGAGYRPRACGTPVFGDVPAASPFCPFVEELARRGVVAGCGGGLFCPGAPVTRAETAVFVLRTLDPSLSPPACGTPLFADVPVSSPYCRWIEEMARRGISAGCGGGSFCPDAAVSRAQMAVFVATGFGLSLYAP